ncbi:MAG TPA: GntR family transcriptional regulator [Acidimicrobiia bacterium]|nr:GntR family transcriptional regulator [Acidimicrobiia bacterium]
MTVAHQVAAVLRDEILRAEAPPGARLRQEEIAGRLGVSTTPVREAFRILEAEGLVRLDPGRGVLVFRPSIEEVRETYELREALEMLAVQHVVENLNDNQIEQLEGILDDLEQTSDHDEWIRLNNLYHDQMYAFASRPKLSSIIVSLRDSMAGYMHSAIQRAIETGRAAREHRAILEACRSGDVEGAKEAVRVHMHHTVELALRFLEEDGSEL